MNRTLFAGLLLVFAPMTFADTRSEVLTALAVIEDTGRTDEDRITACGALAKRVAPDDPALCESVVVALGRTLTDEKASVKVRSFACRALFPYHHHLKPIVPQLRAVHRDSEQQFLGDIRMTGPRDEIPDLLARCGPAGVPALAELLAEGDREQRFEAAGYLAEMGPTAAGAIPALRKCLQSDDAELRVAAAEALLEIDWPDESAEMVPFLARMCSCESGAARERAWAVLERLGPKAVGALPELRRRFAPKHLRWSVLRIIRGMGPAARELIPDVRANLERLPDGLLDGIDPTQPAAFLWLVGRDHASLDVLLQAVEQGEPRSEWEFALDILGKTGRNSPEVFRGLRRLRDRLPEERLPYLLIALWKTATVEDGDGLRFDGREEAIDDLIPLLDGTSRKTLWMVGEAGIKSPRLVPPLRELISQRDGGCDELEDAVKLLGDFGSPARSAVPRLWEIANDRRYLVKTRRSAALAVARIDPSRTDAALQRFTQFELLSLYQLQDPLVAFGPRGRVLIPFLRQRIDGSSRGDYLAASAILWAIDPDEARRLGLPSGREFKKRPRR